MTASQSPARQAPLLYKYAHELFACLERIDAKTRKKFGTDSDGEQNGSAFIDELRARDWTKITAFFRGEPNAPCPTLYHEFMTYLNTVFEANIRMFIGNYWIAVGLNRLLVESPAVVCNGGGFRNLDNISEDEATGFNLLRMRTVLGRSGEGGLFRAALLGEQFRAPSSRIFQSFSQVLFGESTKKRQLVVCKEGAIIHDQIDEEGRRNRIVIEIEKMDDLRKKMADAHDRLDGAAQKDYRQFLSVLNEVAGTGQDELLNKLSVSMTEGEFGVNRGDVSPSGLLSNILMLLYADPDIERGWKYLWFVPAKLPDDMAAGGLVLFFNKLPYDGTDEVQEPPPPKIVSVIQSVVNAVVSYPTNLMIKEERDAHARRAAAAAIMARNFSHNIGSHVTPRTRLEDLRTRVRELLFDKSWWEGGDWNQVVYPAVAELKDTLDEYIQRKAEFIAEFSTDPRISSRSAAFFRDLMLPFMCNTALIDTLAANEGFRYRAFDEPGLVIRCFRKKKDNSYDEYVPRFRTEWAPAKIFKWPSNVRGAPFALRHPDAPSTELFIDDCNVPDVRLALPGPVGEMALYGILENIVRNAAKHSKRRADTSKEPRCLEIHVVIDAGKAEDPDCSIRIYDSLSVPTVAIAAKLKKWIQAPLVEADGQCRKEAWGLAEMRLCADLLGGRTPGESDNPPNLSVAETPEQAVEQFLDKRQPECLSYSLKVPKARTAVFYGWAELKAGQRDKLAGNGFLVCAASKPLAPATLDGGHATQFAVLDARFAEATTNWDELRRALPPRLIVAGKVPKLKPEYDLSRLAFIDKRPSLADSASQADTELTPWLWQTWLRHLGTKPGQPGQDARLTLDLFLQQVKTIEPTATFCRKADEHNGALPAGKLPAAVRVWGTEQQNLKCFTDEKRSARNNGRRFIVDRHGIFVSESGYWPQTSDRLFWIDKQNRDFDLLFNPPKSDIWTLPYELAEAGLLRILILDERILQNAMKPFAADGAGRDGAAHALTGRRGIAPLGWHAAERAGIYLVTHLEIAASKGVSRRTFDIAAQDWIPRQPGDLPELRLPITFAGVASVMEDFRSRRWPASKSVGESDMAWQAGGMPINIAEGIDVAIVHQGVVDRINDEFKDLSDADGQFLRVLSKACTLIVESGRGIPPEVQKGNERFLPFSSIERAFHGGRVAKLLLTRTVMETTRRRGV